MKHTKRLLAMLLTVCMVLAMLPTAVLTASAATVTGTFTKVTSLADATSGQYVIVGTKTSGSYGRLTYGTLDKKDRIPYTEEYTSASALPASIQDPDGLSVWTLEISGTNVTIYNAEKQQYLNTGFAYATSDPTSYTLSYNEAGYFNLKSGSNYIGVNRSADFWKTYATSTLTNNGGLYLYKLESGASTTTYTLTYSANTTDEVTGLPEAVTGIAEGTTYTLSTATPVRTGYTFLGWALSENSTETVTTVEMDGSKTVYAVWEAKAQYTVSYYTKDGDAAVLTKTYYAGDTIDAADVPTVDSPEGFSFKGWYGTAYSDTAAPAYITPAGTTVSGDLTFRAVYAELGEGGGSGGWEEKELSAIADGTRLVIVSSKSSSLYALSNDNGTSSAPSAVSVTASGTSLASDPADTIIWTLEKSDDGYRFKSGTNYLYCTNTNNGVRVGTNTNNVFTVDASGYLKHTNTGRFIGVYNGSDWRCYTITTGNIAGQTFIYYAEQAGTSYTGYTTNPIVANSHTVTWYNADGSTFKTTSVKEGAAIIEPSDSPVKADEGETYYAFAGWAKTEDATAALTDLGTMGETDMHFYPVFTAAQYTYTAEISGSDTLRVGKTKNLTATLTATPEKDVSGYTAEWSTDAPNIVSVDTTGKLTGIALGSATITVTFKSADGTTVATATKTVTVTESVGGYTLMTKANTTDNDADFDWSGDYIIAGRKSGNVADINNYQILTPAWGQTIGSTAYDVVIEDGGSGQGVGKAQNNASIATLDENGSGTLATAYSSGTTANGAVITMEKTGDNVAYDAAIFDRITEIDDGFAFTIEQVDDVNHYYTIRIKGTNYYLANSNTTDSGNNAFGYVLDASADDTKALWTISWHTGVTTVDGYQADVVNIQSVYYNNRSILFNTQMWGTTGTENARFRVYGGGAYSEKLNKDSYGSGLCYNLFLFGNPNPFRAQIYYTGEQITVANAGEIPYGKETATLTSALVPSIDDYPNWSQVGTPTWSIVEKNNSMTIDPDTGVITTNGSASGTYALVQVSYVVHDDLNNVNHTISTQAKVVVGAQTATYATVIYETLSGADTEVQYTVYKTDSSAAADCILPLDAYVLNELTDDNSKTGSVVKAGTAAWSVVNNTDASETVSITADGSLDYSAVTKDSILTVTVSGLTGDGTDAGSATYKVYVKLVSYTAQITHDGGTTGDFTVPFGSSSIPLDKLVKDSAGETSGFTVNSDKLVWATNNADAVIVKNADGTATLDVSGLAAGTVVTVYVSGMTATDDDSGVTANVPRTSVKITVGEQSTDVIANNDTVIVDYDRAVTFDILANDVFTNTAAASVVLNGAPTGFTVNADMTVTFKPDGMLNAAVSCTYTVTAENGKTASATITVKPAAAIYYEDSNSAFSYTDGKHGAWTTLGTESVTEQTSSLTAADIVEFDTNYDGVYTQYSAGSVHKVNVTKAESNASASVKNPFVEFDFAGTGFDVVSVTSNNTGAFLVQVTKDGKSVYSKLISTYRGYQYIAEGFEAVSYQQAVRCDKDGTESSTGAYSKTITDANGGFTVHYETEGFFVKDGDSYVTAPDGSDGPFFVKRVETHYWKPVDDAENLDYYQIPVLKVNGLDYGIYHVKITAAYTSAYDIKQDGEYDFFFDAVRIHDPIENEASLTYISIRDAIIEAGGFGSAEAEPCGHTGSSHWELGTKASYNASETLNGRGKLVEKCDVCGNVINTTFFYVTATAETTALSTETETDSSKLSYAIAVDGSAPDAAKAVIAGLTFSEFWKSNSAEIANCYNNANVVYAMGAGTTYVTLQLTGSDGKIYASAIHTGEITVTGHTHVWGSSTVTQAATCTTAGLRVYSCTVSGCSKTKTENILALGHTYGDWSTDSNEHWHVCARCSSVADKATHNMVYDETLDKDVCSVCGYVAGGTVHTHSYTATVTTEPTCGKAGVRTYTCTCGDSYTEEIPATGEHSYTDYTENGASTHYALCGVCGDVIEEPHTFDAGVTSGSTITYTCTKCSYAKTETVSGYTLTFNVPSTQTAPLAATGTSATLPSMDDYDTADGVSYTFVGWVAAATEATTTAPTLYTAGSTYTFDADTALYACYTYSVTSGGSGDWTLVTDATTLKAGDLLLIASNTKDCVAGEIASSIMGVVTAEFSTDLSTVTKPDDAVVLTLGGESGTWTLANESGKLLGATAAKKMAWDTGTTTWTISIASDSSATIQNTTSGYGRILHNVNDPRFTTYTSATSKSMLPPQLYRQSGSGTGTTTTYYTTGDAGTTATVTYTVNLTVDNATIAVGATTSVQAALYADGVEVADAVPAWSTSKSSVATIAASGNACTVTGVAAGTTQVRATYTLPDGTTKYSYKTITVTDSGNSTEQPATYSTTYNSGTRGVVCTAISANGGSDYYTEGTYDYATLSQQTGSTLLASLRALNTARKTGSTSYDDCKSYANKTDCQNEDQKVTLLYTGYEATMSQNSASAPGWNREHVWPKSLGGFETSGPGADILHIRPDDVTTNSDRGNKKFGYVTDGTASTATITGANDALGGYYSSSYYEPLDSVKGDVARICLYVYMGYGSSYTQCNDLTNVFESTDVLLEWMQKDPVDTWEMGRNEVAQAIQGNRNPFVDYPEYAWLLLGQSVPSGYVTPSNPTGATGTAATQNHSETRAVTPEDIISGVTGTAIIDGKGSEFSMEEFEKYGPKTEVYLSENQAVIFYLENGAAGTDVQIGAKAVNATPANLTVITLRGAAAGGAVQTKSAPLVTATEMYYEIGGDLVWNGATSCAIVVANTGKGVMALTNVRSSAAIKLQINRATAEAGRSVMQRVADDTMIYGMDDFTTLLDSAQATDPTLPEDPIDPIDPKPADPEPTEPKGDPESFTDLEKGAWYYESVSYAIETGLMNGVGEHEFAPDDTLTRAMLVTILYRQAGEPTVAKRAAFADVAEKSWYADAVAWAVERGITYGMGDNLFAPDEPVTREQMVTFLWRFAGKPESAQTLADFPDADKVPDYAKAAFAWAVEKGIVNGNPIDGKVCLDPSGTATRAQIAAIFARSKDLLAND